MKMEQFYYDNKIVKKFIYATLLWGIVGFSIGLLLALMFLFPNITDGISWLSFGRLRPLHTNAVIFAFVGNAIYAGVYYSLQRLLKTRMASNFLSNFNFWGWQAIIVAAAITLPLGYTTSKEYAELEWPIDIAIALVWVAFGVNMIWTILQRRQRHLYVAVWFYLGTFVTVAVLHIFNSLELPVSFLKSYSVYAGVQDALVQWWYGHNAVAFFLTTPFLGLMYYFVPKAANRPVYSYKLSIVHFWSLIFIYIWAGPHHLLYTSLPDWAQSIGTVFSIMLIAPSWGGMINGLLTLRGAYDRVRDNPVLKFLVVGVTAYGMSTFEGPMLSLKSVNAIAHYTDYIIAHVHMGALAWNGGLTFAMLYYIVPRIYKTQLFSKSLANTHFWFATLGLLFYAIPLYVAGITQSLMWKEFTVDGFLRYPNFVETLTQIMPMYMLRVLGGILYITGALFSVFNLYKTAKSGSLWASEPDEAPEMIKIKEPMPKFGNKFHHWLESKPAILTILALLAVLVGGIVEFIPTVMVESNIPKIASVKPYTPLELIGRDIYIREGCNNCHSQMIRPFRSETERYGEYSKAGEFVYDHPFLWGSRRAGPDLHRVGGKYPDSWHYLHMREPESTSPQSIMPRYPWIYEKSITYSDLDAKIGALKFLNVPYTFEAGEAEANARIQAAKISKGLKEAGFADAEADKEIVAVIAYLQRLGTDIKAANASTASLE